MAKKPIPLPVEPVEETEQECPKCPPVGAPAWMATFSDIAILLMAFFVLILSFAEFNQPKFKMIAGSLKESFGVQRELPVIEQPRGTTMLELNFSPSPDPSVTKTITQDTTEREQPKIKTDQSDHKDSDQHDNKMSAEEQKQQLAEMLQQALQDGELQARIENDQVVLDYQPSAANDTQQNQTDSQTQSGQSQGDDQGNPSSQDLMQQLVQDLNSMAKVAMDSNTVGENAAEGLSDQPTGNGGEGKAAIASDRLAVALRQELGEGLVHVEQRGDQVFVTVGAGGAFPSGTADLTQEAREIMDRIAFSAMNDASTITVTGHTDNVPLSSGSQFRDNWGLAAARSASVVREFAASGLIDPSRLTATSEGESNPVADNSTAEGREKNRRIEIEISY